MRYLYINAINNIYKKKRIVAPLVINPLIIPFKEFYMHEIQHYRFQEVQSYANMNFNIPKAANPIQETGIT